MPGNAKYFEDCLACGKKTLNLALDPCGHVCVCKACAFEFSCCPVCRKEIRGVIERPSF